jgi:hypothetical protein
MIVLRYAHLRLGSVPREYTATWRRLGWYEAFHLLLVVNPTGSIIGFGFGAARIKEQPLAETFFALRCHPHFTLPSVGAPAAGP